jgi:hypothetical protein
MVGVQALSRSGRLRVISITESVVSVRIVEAIEAMVATPTPCVSGWRWQPIFGLPNPGPVVPV